MESVEKMNEEPKFLETGFNPTNYEAFVKAKGVIPVSEECNAIIK